MSTVSIMPPRAVEASNPIAQVQFLFLIFSCLSVPRSPPTKRICHPSHAAISVVLLLRNHDSFSPRVQAVHAAGHHARRGAPRHGLCPRSWLPACGKRKCTRSVGTECIPNDNIHYTAKRPRGIMGDATSVEGSGDCASPSSQHGSRRRRRGRVYPCTRRSLYETSMLGCTY